MRVVVAGSLAQRPGRGGHAWVFLQYLLGLRRLGCDVVFVDRLEAGMCSDAGGRPCPPEDSENLRYLAAVMDGAGLAGSWAVLVGGGRRSLGMARTALVEHARGAELLLDVMGYLEVEELLEAPARRCFLDIDPGFPQLWAEQGLHDAFGRHDVYATFGTNLGRAGCTVPDRGIAWVPTRPPVVLDEWPVCPSPDRRVTSVGTWRGPFDPIEHDGRRYGLRAHRMRALAGLPAATRRATGAAFELALDIDPADAADARLLEAGGWTLVDPLAVAATPGDYRRYVQGSSAELLVPKDLYLQGRVGWFSDRSACYLASGKPVLVLDPWPPAAGAAGSLPALPTGKGLLAFADLGGAAAAVDEVFAQYDLHAEAARGIAEEHFDSDVVLGRLLDDVGTRR